MTHLCPAWPASLSPTLHLAFIPRIINEGRLREVNRAPLATSAIKGNLPRPSGREAGRWRCCLSLRAGLCLLVAAPCALPTSPWTLAPPALPTWGHGRWILHASKQRGFPGGTAHGLPQTGTGWRSVRCSRPVRGWGKAGPSRDIFKEQTSAFANPCTTSLAWSLRSQPLPSPKGFHASQQGSGLLKCHWQTSSFSPMTHSESTLQSDLAFFWTFLPPLPPNPALQVRPGE